MFYSITMVCTYATSYTTVCDIYTCIIQYPTCSIDNSYYSTFYQGFVIPECILVADLNCFAILWAESHLSKRMVFSSCTRRANPLLPI